MITTTIPTITAGISKIPMPSGINKNIRTEPIIAPIIVKIILNKTTPIFNAATINIKNKKNPIKISILYLPFILLYYIIYYIQIVQN